MECSKIKQSRIQQIMNTQSQQHHFLLFVNSKSGGRLGMKYLSLGESKIKFKSKEGYYVYIYLYDLFNKTQKENGLSNTLNLSKISKNLNIIICGGDGTVLWVVNEILRVGVDASAVCFGIIPIGTGNDFSRSLGWGGSPIHFSGDDISQLRVLIRKWIRAAKENFDLWDTTIATYKNGRIRLSSLNVEQNDNAPLVEYTKTFSNYLGVGIDARVSYHFEQNRTKSKLLNLVIYGCLGLCFCFQKTDKIHQVISEFSESQSESENQQDQSTERQKTLDEEKLSKNKMKLLQKNISSQFSEVKLKKGYTGLVCLNCTSYMSGVKNIFNTQKIAARNKKLTDFSQSKFNDGKLEFVGFKNELSLGLQRFISTAGKVSQGKGPFYIKFHELEQMRETFIQIDGEAMHVQGLKEIKITKSNLTPTGQIRVLVRRRQNM